jgi:hypothetical protein
MNFKKLTRYYCEFGEMYEESVKDNCPGRWVDADEAQEQIDSLMSFVKEIAEGDCEYGDDCPMFSSKHYQCDRCRARDLLDLKWPKECA